MGVCDRQKRVRVSMLPNVVLFQAIDSTGTDSLWETNGTASGTFELTSSGGPPVSGQAPITGEAIFGFAPDPEVSIDLTVFHNQALFIGRVGPGDLGPFELWTTDGTAAGTVELNVAEANSAGLFMPTTVLPDLTVFGSEVLFNGRDTAGKQGLWTTNGTAGGTQEVTGIAGAASTGVNPSDMTVFNGGVLFDGVDTAGNHGLWTTNGTAAGTREVTGIIGARTAGGLDPPDMTVFGNEVLFNGVDASGQSGLWVTNGTAAGTHEISGIAGADPSGLNPTDMTVFGNEV